MSGLNRRAVLLGGAGFLGGAGLLLASGAQAQGPNHWYDLKDKSGAPLPNMRLPVELTAEFDHLPGVFWAGASRPDVSIIEVYDYNCPWCHAAARDLNSLLAETKDLRVGFMNNSILAPGSAQAAKVELALLRAMGPQVAYEFYRAMFSRKGQADGKVALNTAKKILAAHKGKGTGKGGGAPTLAELERLADSEDTINALQRQMKLAASLGMSATPSFVTGGVGIQGYPGTETLRKIVNAMRQCDEPVCKS